MSAESGWLGLLEDGDTGLHIRIGDLILNSHSIPTTDPFSFSKPGQPWFAHEWLSGVIYALVVRAAGLKALVLLTGAILAMYNTLLLRDMLRRGANSLLAIALTLAATNAASIHYHARPHVFTLLFVTLAMALIAQDRREPTSWIWLLIPMTALWANLHGGFVVLLAVLGLAAGSAFAESYWSRGEAALKRKLALRYLCLTAACLGASFLNPQGIKLHLHIIEVLRTPWFKTHIGEYHSPSFTSEPMLFYMALLFLGLMSAYGLLRKRMVTEALWIIFFAYWSLSSVRNVPLFLIVALPLIALELSAWWRELAAGASRQSTIGVLDDIANQTSGRFRPIGLWAGIFIAGIFFFAPANRWPSDFAGKFFPLSMLHKHAEQFAHERVFTLDQWGDYLIYMNYPRQKVFVDGRSDFYGEAIGNDYLGIYDGRPEWRGLLNRYAFDMVLCPPDLPLVSLLRLSTDWRVIDQDRDSVLFAKADSNIN